MTFVHLGAAETSYDHNSDSESTLMGAVRDTQNRNVSWKSQNTWMQGTDKSLLHCKYKHYL